MTIARAMKGALVLALAVLPASRPLATDIQGAIGVGYNRTDTYDRNLHLTEPGLALDGNIGATGYFVEPGLVDWGLGAGYTNRQDLYSQYTSRTDGLTYNARLGLLEARGTKLQLGGTATRMRQEFSSETPAVTTTGTTISEMYEVHAGAGWPGFPTLRSSFSWSTRENHGFDRPDTRDSYHSLDVGGAMAPFNLQVDYGLRWGDGTFGADNYRSQQLRLSTNNQPARDVDVRLDAAYFVRDPATFSPGNPRYDDTLLNGRVAWTTSSTDSLQVGYQYAHNLVVDPALAAREQLSNSISGSYNRRLSPEWTGALGVSGGVNHSRLGSDQLQSTGESLGAQGFWSRPSGSTVYGSNFGARVGLVQPETGPAQGAYGGSAGVHVTWQSALFREYQLIYNVSYDKNLDAAVGWQTLQFASANMSGLLAPTIPATAKIEANALRGGGGPFGDNATRSILAQGTVGYRRLRLALDLATADAVTGPLSNPVSEGLFLPPGYNTHSRSAALSATLRLTPNINTRARARYAIASGPTTPDQRETLYELGVYASTGPWILSIEERYTMGGANGWDNRVNQFFVNVTRTFGTRY
jgi:hypothetical protein